MEGSFMRLFLALAVLLLVAPLTGFPAAAQAFPGVAGDRYVSPQFGYSLQWDEPWEVDRSLSRPGFDALALSNGTSEFVLSSTTGFAGATGYVASPEQCVESSVRALITRPGTQPALLQDEAGQPRQNSEADLAWVEVGYDDLDGTPMVAYVSCQILGLPSGLMQTIIHLAPEQSYDAEAVIVDALLDRYQAPHLDLDQLDQGPAPEPAP
jgi:hypothetical protein